MPAHLKFINVLLVPLNSALLSAHAIKNRVTGGDGPTDLVSPTEVYKSLKLTARQREITCVTYSRYRALMDASDPRQPNPQIGLPQEDWDLYFNKTTMFDFSVQRYLYDVGAKTGYDFTLILYPQSDALKRIEIMEPELSRPAILWLDGKGAHPNATTG